MTKQANKGAARMKARVIEIIDRLISEYESLPPNQDYCANSDVDSDEELSDEHRDGVLDGLNEAKRHIEREA